MACPAPVERVWVDKYMYNDAEKRYYELQKPLLEDKKEDHSTPVNENVIAEEKTKNKKSKKNKKDKKSSISEETVDNPIEAHLNVEKIIEKESQIIVNEPKTIINNKKKNKTLNKDIEVIQADEWGDMLNKEETQIDESEEKPMITKKSKSRKQKEKKAAAAAAAAALIQEQVRSCEIITNVSKTQSKANIKTNNVEPIEVTVKSKEKKKKEKTDSSMVQLNSTSQDNLKNGSGANTNPSTLASEIAKARQHIKSSLERVDGATTVSAPGVLLDRISALENDDKVLRGIVQDLQKKVAFLEDKLNSLVISGVSAVPAPKSVPASTESKDDDDGVDLFGSDDEDDEEANAIREQRLKQYADKKSKKPALIAKSSVTLDIKPWDDETDMKKMEEMVRSISADGLLWGASKLAPLAYGIHKLTILCIVEDDKVSIDWLQEEIEKFEDLVQSVDIAAFNKI